MTLELSGLDSISDLLGLVNMTSLTELILGHTKKYPALAPLASLKRLEKLKLNWSIQITNLPNLAPLSKLLALITNLKRLELSNCHGLDDSS
jgi:hypothetical protein